MGIEAGIFENGEHVISRDNVDVVLLPVVTVANDVLVCEFQRLAAGKDLTLATVLEWISHALLAALFDGDHDGMTLQLIDLDAQRWTHAVAGKALVDLDWTAVMDGLPPGLDGRRTALSTPKAQLELPERARFDGFRNKWLRACASPDGRFLATYHGKKGSVLVTDLESGAVQKLGSLGGNLEMSWGACLVCTQHKTGVYWWDGAEWQHPDFGVGSIIATAWSPDGATLAIASTRGSVTLVDWASQTVRLRFSPDKGVYGVQWTLDGSRLVVGYESPRIAVHSAEDGRSERVFSGTLHCQQNYLVGPHGELVTGLRMHSTTVFDLVGVRVLELPNTSTHSIHGGGFGRAGRVLVTECYEASSDFGVGREESRWEPWSRRGPRPSW